MELQSNLACIFILDLFIVALAHLCGNELPDSPYKCNWSNLSGIWYWIECWFGIYINLSVCLKQDLTLCSCVCCLFDICSHHTWYRIFYLQTSKNKNASANANRKHLEVKSINSAGANNHITTKKKKILFGWIQSTSLLHYLTSVYLLQSFLWKNLSAK